MSWMNEVLRHSSRFNRTYVEQSIEQSIEITFTKLINCLYDEVTSPIQWVEESHDTKKLYLSDDTCIMYRQAQPLVHLYENNMKKTMMDPLELIDWLALHSQGVYDYGQLKIEIENHLINQALSLIYCAHMPKSDHPLLHGEQYVVQGHNIHPCAKTKLGLTFDEVMQYSPEYNQAFKLNWVLVKEGLLYNNLEAEELNILAQFSGYKGEIPVGYHLIPVHPYQFKHVISRVYAEEIASKRIILLSHRGGLVKSTSSFRTVCPIDGVTPMMKLPVNSQMTSTIRSISNNSIINSKYIGEYFKYIYQHDERLQEISLPVLEFGGMTYCHPLEEKQRNLSFILRENNAQYLAADASLFAATCLFEYNELGIKVYQDLISSAESIATPMEWFKQYASILIETAVTLMSKYGIGLEAHLQNMSFEFKHGMPSRLHVRDFGGLRIDTTRIPRWVELTQALTNATTEQMYEKVQNTLISNHLETLVAHFSEDYGCEESDLWQWINQTFQTVFNQLRLQNLPHVQPDMNAFYTETINEKALLTMRISPASGDIYVQKSNPLVTYDHVQV
ncbi:siderophore biosynthesis protein, IucA/IucC family [Staphylococcus sp. SQ8-PEA]|uniref:Siderophore biosynthesis protein, IucA/IucC family n=1 Tax=Staphylococcus marylandisciuri TaxID=2981529 RepID=A0ABT2QSG0_9STAP|nr:IucA/IucC family protein [Staphylococcus marylandisciuri]MCU5746936.1 siderophore biosynthesis protein, IucA/IucC family [Staphylococcus marylandisciuri]